MGGVTSTVRTGGPGLFGLLRRIYVTPAELEKRRISLDIWRSMTVLAIAIFLSSCGYIALMNIHLNINPPLGTLIVAVTVGVSALAATFVPVAALRKVNHRSMIAGCLAFITVYCGAQFYPLYYTTVPVAVLMGIQAAIFWTAVSSYITRTGEKYADLNNESREVCITRFFGTIYLFYQLSVAVAYVTMVEGFPLDSHPASANGGHPASANGSHAASANGSHAAPSCGFHFCANNATAALHGGPAFATGWIILTGVAFCLPILGAFLVTQNVSKLTDVVGDWRGDSGDPPSIGKQLVEPLKQSVQPYQLLLLPLTLWSGAQTAFLLHAFTRGFVSCSIGSHMTGFVALTFALSSSLTSGLSAYLVQHLGRRSMFLSASFINLSLILLMLNWVPLKEHFPLFFLIAGIWGVADAVWHTQLSALYGVIFPLDTEAVFCCFVMWHSTGYLSVFLTHSLLCVDATIYVLLMLLFSGIIGYLCVEIVEGRRYGDTDPSTMQQLN